MTSQSISKATLGRLPIYLRYLEQIKDEKTCISSADIAKALGLGDVQVRKDLAAVCDGGRPKVGYATQHLMQSLERQLGQGTMRQAVLVGAGSLGRALLDYEGFRDYGVEIAAAFDSDRMKEGFSSTGKPIYRMDDFSNYCYRNDIRIGIITVPRTSAQQICDTMVRANLTAIWNFAPIELNVPTGIKVHQENLALSLAYLNQQI